MGDYSGKTAWGKIGPWAWARFQSWFIGRRFKQVLAPVLAGQQQFAYVKPGGNPQAFFSISRPVSLCELRAAGYLASAVGNATGITPLLRSDSDVRSKLDLDFVSFGGPESNFKTSDCLVNTANDLARFGQGTTQFIDLCTGKPFTLGTDPNFDYGLILKIHPIQFPKRTWLTCAGFGEWGTSGAAWYLANRWREIREKAGERPFAVVVRVRPGQDESAERISIKMGDP